MDASDDSGRTGVGEDDTPLTDDELTALALGADPSAPLADDAVPLTRYLSALPAALPSWYMPAPAGRPVHGWRVPVVLGLVTVFVVLEALGLCSAFGQVVIG
jgi:hypothetical protein